MAWNFVRSQQPGEGHEEKGVVIHETEVKVLSSSLSLDLPLTIYD